MLNLHARATVGKAALPLARGLARAHVTADMLTVVGAVGVWASALYFYPRGNFFWGSVVVTVFVLSDLLDGTLARLTGSQSAWGAFLDSTLDRVSDMAIFSGVALYFAGRGADPLMSALALYCLVSGVVVSYAKARAEGLGMTCNVGIAERSERLIVGLVAVGLGGLGIPYVLAVGLWLLAAAATFTVGERIVEVHRQVVAARRTDG